MSFNKVLRLDPFRIDNFDLLSNLLYVCDYREEIIDLSKYLASIDRYRQETLCVIGELIHNDNHLRLLYYAFIFTIS